MLMGGSALVSVALESMGWSFHFWIVSESAIYGMETYDRFSSVDLFISAIYLFKGFTAYALWTEKDYAITLGLMDGLAGIVICVAMMMMNPIFELNSEGIWDINIRFEILFLLPYVIKCWRMRGPWNQFSDMNRVAIDPVPPAPVPQSPKTVNTPAAPEPKSNVDENGWDKEDPRRFMPNNGDN